MKNSLASNPIIPLVGGIAAAALIFGTLTNGGEEAELTTSSTDISGDPAAGDPTLADPTAGAADPTADTAAAATEEVAKKTLAAGKAGTIGDLKLTVKSVSKGGAVVTVSKKNYTLKTGKPAAIGEYTLTVTKVNTKTKRAAITVES